MEGNNHYNYYALQFIPDDKNIYGSRGYMNGRNTWKDWHLIPSSRPVINPPTIKSNYIDIPGGNGTIDASSILTTYPVYNDREGQIEYYVTRNYEGYGAWHKVYSEILNYLGGNIFKVVMEEDPHFYYRGRINVNQWKSEKDWSKIVLDYHLEPFKYDMLASTDRWKWDPFSFVNGVINPEVNGSNMNYMLNINNSNRESVIIENYNNGEAIYGRKLPIAPGAMPFSPEFSIQCLSPVIPSGGHTWMHVHQVREYSGGRLVDITNKELRLENNNPQTMRFYDMVFYKKDYDEFIFFETPSQYTFLATTNYRRGWL